jgi:GGDEF domain-containing protein
MPPEAVAEMSGRLQKTAAVIGGTVDSPHALSVSVGSASYPVDGGDAETLLSAADHSLYRTKRSRQVLAKAQGTS